MGGAGTGSGRVEGAGVRSGVVSPQSPRTLSEAASKALLRGHGVPLLDEREVTTAEDAAKAAEDLGLPVVVKLCGDAIAHSRHKTRARKEPKPHNTTAALPSPPD